MVARYGRGAPRAPCPHVASSYSAGVMHCPALSRWRLFSRAAIRAPIHGIHGLRCMHHLSLQPAARSASLPATWHLAHSLFSNVGDIPQVVASVLGGQLQLRRVLGPHATRTLTGQLAACLGSVSKQCRPDASFSWRTSVMQGQA